MERMKILYLIGRPFSPVYGLAMRLRERFYRLGLFRVHQAGVPVVSIGNLTMGGSGKTPLVKYVAALLQEKGWQPAVISRGYGGNASRRVNVVSDGRELLLDAEEAGDEPRLLAELLPGIPVLTGKKRKFPAARAVESGADVLVLDDGFQHMSLGRSLDLVLFNADFLAGNSRVFPGGDLREPVRALQRCHGFVLTSVNNRNRGRAEQFADLLRNRFPSHPVFLAEYRPAAVLSLENDGSVHPLPLASVQGRSIYGFSGIAHPRHFRESLVEAGVTVSGFRGFADHHAYDPGDLTAICSEALAVDAEACITTEKDLVKIAGSTWRDLPVYALRMEVHFADNFDEFLVGCLDSARSD